MLSHFDNKYFITADKADKLVIFIHGYNGSPEAIEYAVQWVREKLDNAVLVVPRAPNRCDKDEDNLQWISFYKEDPQVKFRQKDTSVEEIFDISNRLGDDFADIASKMNDFIDEQQKKFGIDDEHTYLMGFSQGAMISIYTSLTRKCKLAGVVSVAGIIPGMVRLEKEIVSYPQFLVLHGKDDATIQYKTLATTLEWLKAQSIDFKCVEFDNLAHRMNEEEMQVAADFINS